MPPDSHFWVSFLTHAPRNDRLLCFIGMFYYPKLVGHLVVESLVNPGQEFDGCGPRQGAIAVHVVDGTLNDDMRARLQGKRAGLLFEFGAGQRPLNIARSGVVPFEQVRLVAVYHADEVGELCRTIRMQPLTQSRSFPLYIDRESCQFGRNMLLEEAGLYPGRCFQHFCRSSTLNK